MQELGQGYYKLLDPRYKYPKCFCTDEEIRDCQELYANVLLAGRAA